MSLRPHHTRPVAPWLIALLVLSSWQAASVAKPAKPARKGDAAAKAKEADAVRQKYYAARKEKMAAERALYMLRRKIEQTDALAGPRTALFEADKAYYAKRNEITAKPRAAEMAAYEALKALAEKKVAATKVGAALQKAMADQDEKRARHSMEIAVLDLQLRHRDSPLLGGETRRNAGSASLLPLGGRTPDWPEPRGSFPPGGEPAIGLNYTRFLPLGGRWRSAWPSDGGGHTRQRSPTCAPPQVLRPLHGAGREQTLEPGLTGRA